MPRFFSEHKAQDERSGTRQKALHFVSRRTPCKGDKARAMIPGIGFPVSRVPPSMAVGNSGLSLDVRLVYHMSINLLQHNVLLVPVGIHDLHEVYGGACLYAGSSFWCVR
jgi:hypothetical protein